MKVKDLVEILNSYPDDEEVVLRVNNTQQDEIEDGDVLMIFDERSIIFEYGKVTIIGDVPEEGEEAN